MSANLKTAEDTSANGLPTFTATVSGITDDDPYWYLDFSSSHTLAWNTNCTTTGFGGYPAGSCTGNPVFAVGSGFSNASLPQTTGTFTNAKFGGYVVSGHKFTAELCFGGINCKFIQIYSGEKVSADNWLYDHSGAYGIIGMAPGSFIWTGFVDPNTQRTKYSIELPRINSLGATLGDTTAVASNLTFGSANDASYAGHEYINATSNSDHTYDLNNFEFGIIYQTDGADSSQYFYELNASYPVMMNTNFRGLGLPSDLYQSFVSLFEYITGSNVECSNTLDGICVLSGPCANFTAYNDYFFLFNFTGATNDNYLRLPLAALAEERVYGPGNTVCNVNINYLDTLQSQSNQIILGGMFFQEFFGVFENDYSDLDNIGQSM